MWHPLCNISNLSLVHLLKVLVSNSQTLLPSRVCLVIRNRFDFSDADIGCSLQVLLLHAATFPHISPGAPLPVQTLSVCPCPILIWKVLPCPRHWAVFSSIILLLFSRVQTRCGCCSCLSCFFSRIYS